MSLQNKCQYKDCLAELCSYIEVTKEYGDPIKKDIVQHIFTKHDIDSKELAKKFFEVDYES